MKPNAQQGKWIARVVNEPTRAALMNLSTGAGKTALGLWISQQIGANTTLVVAPLNAEDGWEGHVKKVGMDLPFKVIDSAHLSRFDELRRGEPGVYFVTRSYFGLSGTSLAPRQKPDGTWTKGRAQVLDWTKAKPDLMIFDESHEGNNRDTATYRVLKHPKPGFKIALSATPAGNKFDRLWETTRWLWPDKIDASKNRWCVAWCALKSNPWKRRGWEVVGELNPGAFVASLPCYVVDDGKTGKVPVRTIVVKTPLTGVQRQQYNEMLRDSIAWLDNNPLVAALPIVQRIRLRQMALGEVYFNDKGEVDFHDNCVSPKIEACRMILDRHPGEQILFLTDSEKFAKVLTKRLGEGAATWSGKISKAKRKDLKQQFLNGSCRYLVAVIAAFGVGTDGLQSVCSTEVWLNKSINDMHNKQGEGRLNRTGQKSSMVTRYTLIAPDSGDTQEFSRLALNRARLDKALQGG